MAALGQAVRTVIRRCLGVHAGEELLVIVDPVTRAIGEALREEGAAAGADAALAVMDVRATDGTEPHRSVAAALGACDVYIAATSKSLSHTCREKARDRRRRARRNDARRHRGHARARDGRRLRDDEGALRGARRAALPRHVRARELPGRVSDFTVDLSARRGISDDGDLTAPGAFGNLPCGEAFIAPLGGNGRIAAVSLAPLGISDEPATLTIRDGRIAEASGGLGPQYLELLEGSRPARHEPRGAWDRH